MTQQMPTLTVFDLAKKYPVFSTQITFINGKKETPPPPKGWNAISAGDFTHVKDGQNAAGVLTGSKSNLIVVDLDKHGKTGESETWEMFEREMTQDEWAEGVTTQSGGRHFYYSYSLSCGQLASMKNRAGILPGLDVRGDGGFVFAPISERYSGEIPESPQAMPDWLVNILNGSKINKKRLNEQAEDLGVDLKRIRLLQALSGSNGNICPPIKHCNGEIRTSFTSQPRTCYISGFQHETNQSFNIELAGEKAYFKCLHSRCLQMPRKEIFEDTLEAQLVTFGLSHQLSADIFDKTESKACCKYSRSSGWWFWDRRWMPNADHLVRKAILHELNIKIEQTFSTDKNNKMYSNSISVVKSVRELECIVRAIADRCYEENFVDKLDQNGDVVGFDNGVFDVAKGTLRMPTPSDYISKSMGWDYQEAKPEEIKKLDELLFSIYEDREMQEYVMKSLASAMFISAFEEFFVHTGTGRNGKGAISESIEAFAGEYSGSVPYESMASSLGDKPSPNLAQCRGIRYLVSSEPQGDCKLATSTIKLMTGGDPVMVRELYKTSFNLKPTFVWILLANGIPQLQQADCAIKERMRCIEYDLSFVHDPKAPHERKQKASFKKELKSLRAAWFSKLIGYYDTIRNMESATIQPIPDKVNEATYDEIEIHLSDVKAWLLQNGFNGRVDNAAPQPFDEGFEQRKTSTSDLLTSFKESASMQNKMNQRAFGNILSLAGCYRARNDKRRFWRDVNGSILTSEGIVRQEKKALGCVHPYAPNRQPAPIFQTQTPCTKCGKASLLEICANCLRCAAA